MTTLLWSLAIAVATLVAIAVTVFVIARYMDRVTFEREDGV